MCLIIDTNTFKFVTDTTNTKHAYYVKILELIGNNKIKVTIGGTRYKKEIFHNFQNVKVVEVMSAKNQVVTADDDAVDLYESQIKKDHPEKGFDDPHIVALASITAAKLVTTEDRVCIKYLSERKFYKKGCASPKVFNSRTSSQAFFKSFRLSSRCWLCR